jgi:hypothetical protein
MMTLELLLTTEVRSVIKREESTAVKPAAGILVLSPCAKANDAQRQIQYNSMPFFIEFNGRTKRD